MLFVLYPFHAGNSAFQVGVQSYAPAPAVPSWPGVAVFVLMIVWALLWPRISEYAALSPFAARVALVAYSLFPVAFFMGIPFPLGLRAAGRLGQRSVALAWAVNGVMSVLGSVAAITIAILAGFSMVYLAAAFVYLLVAVVVRGIGAKQVE